MANVADAAVSGGVALGITLIGWAVKALFSRPREQAAARKDISDAIAKDHETWRGDYDHAYQQVKKTCDECVRKLDKFSDAFYGLLDDLDEQIAPMLLLPNADHELTRDAMRSITRKARESVRDTKSANGQ